MPDVTMPRLSDTMQEGTIARWLKHAGDEVKKGDILAEVETDKATMELESYDSGVLEKIVVQEGQNAPIGQVVAIIGSGKGAQAKQEPPAAAEAAAQTPAVDQASSMAATDAAQITSTPPPAEETPAEASQAQASTKPSPAQPTSQREEADGASATDQPFVKASPLARRMAEEHHIELEQIQGTGPNGRIVRDDIEDFLEQQRAATAATPAAPAEAAAPTPSQEPVAAIKEGESVPLSRMQATIARRLTEAKQSIPHFYVSNDVDMTDALTLRKMLNESSGEDGVKISVNDLIIKACALALEKFPEVNSSYLDGQFIRHQDIHIGIAVDIPGGLVVPVLRHANIKGVRTIAREARTLIEKARANKLTPAEMSGSTFSISNLGMMDVTDFIAVINLPEAAILAIGSTRRQFVPIEEQPVLRDIMPMTISADHRILYGATAARFIQEVKRLLQSPYNLLG
ncbi:MAG TPA: dihydrolipoamide acetyltransferase family protein [Ktedonobacteraceae bacterium]|nr:dihydrolipoamide acetyltransferase family protein [Ktedonobacteraceae bacterium]